MRRLFALGRIAASLLLGSSCSLLLSARASAEEGPAQCLQAYEDGQNLRRQGDLLSASQKLLACGGPACPVRMQRDCQRWWDEVQRSLPTVVFRVRGADNTSLPGASIAIDGADAQPLDGRALQMNPGQHLVVFEHPGYAPLRTPVFITEGEKLEPHDVTLTALSEVGRPQLSAAPRVPAVPLDPAPPSARVTRSWTGPIAAGAVAALGGVGLAYFGSSAKSGEQALDRCTPNCSQGSVDAVKRDYLMANLSLGIGVAALVGAGLMLLLDDGAAPSTNSGSGASAPATSAAFGVVRF
jgi:hypothetical protein